MFARGALRQLHVMLLSRAVCGWRCLSGVTGTTGITTKGSLGGGGTALMSLMSRRGLSSSDSGYRSGKYDKNTTSDGRQQEEEDGGIDANAMFSHENIRNLPPTELARMNVIHSLIQDHVDAIRRGYSHVDPASNPLIDPRSFELKRLPRVPADVLKHFRTELPASVADETRPIVTREIWDANPNTNTNTNTNTSSSSSPSSFSDTLISESASEIRDWDRVDERTMTAAFLSRRNRTTLSPNNKSKVMPSTAAASAPQFVTGAATQLRKKKPIVLRDSSGRIDVDFRAVATLHMFLTPGGKILPRRRTGLSAKSQKKLSKAIKRARNLALVDPAPSGPSMKELVQMHSEEELDDGEEFRERLREIRMQAAGGEGGGGGGGKGKSQAQGQGQGGKGQFSRKVKGKGMK